MDYKKQNDIKRKQMKKEEAQKVKKRRENIACTFTLGYTSPTLGYSFRTPAALL
jgi:hypothetical protein